MGLRFCPRCESVTTPRRCTPGSLGIEVLLWLAWFAHLAFMLIMLVLSPMVGVVFLPGFAVIFVPILYSLWRMSVRYDACPACGAPHMVPLSSPVAARATANPAAPP
jgi:hypothetical protein